MNQKIRVVLKTEDHLANAIRRSVGEIPIPAIDSVEIHKNDSALYDEVLAHRIGLVPVKTSRKLNETDKCVCKGKGCPKCQLQLVLKAKGPGIIYSGDIKGDVEIIYDKMPLVILDKEQEIEIICFVQLGKGKSHAKFSPGLVYYRNVSEAHDNLKEIEEKLKENIIEKGKNSIKLDCDEDYINAKLGKEVKVSSVEDEIVFLIESWGQMDTKEIFSMAVEELNNNLEEVVKQIK